MVSLGERAGGWAERNMQRGRPQRTHSVGETPATVLRSHYPPLSAVLSFKGRTDGERKNSRRLEAKGRRHRSTARMEGERRSACICVCERQRETQTYRAGAAVHPDAVFRPHIVRHHLLRHGGVGSLRPALSAVAEEPPRRHQLQNARERALGDDAWLRELRSEKQRGKDRADCAVTVRRRESVSKMAGLDD